MKKRGRALPPGAAGAASGWTRLARKQLTSSRTTLADTVQPPSMGLWRAIVMITNMTMVTLMTMMLWWLLMMIMTMIEMTKLLKCC